MSAFGFFSFFDYPITHWLANAAAVVALIGGGLGFYYMYKLYRIPARPYWNHWHTGANFKGTLLAVAAALIAVVGCFFLDSVNSQVLINQMALITVLGLLTEIVGVIFHARDLKRQGGEGAASHFEQTTKFGKAYILRNSLLLINLCAALGITYWKLTGVIGITIGSLFVMSLMVSTIIGRALFYVLVIPTTMPGAFFWKNKGFQEHARESGLANMPQVGVVPDLH